LIRGAIDDRGADFIPKVQTNPFANNHLSHTSLHINMDILAFCNYWLERTQLIAIDPD